MKWLQECRSAMVGNAGNLWADAYFLVVLSSGILGFLSWRGWTNIALFLLLVPAMASCRRSYAAARMGGNLPALGPLVLTLALPVLVLILSQLLRQNFVPKAYDGPLRMLLAIPLLYYFIAKQVDFARLLGLVAPLALFILVAEVRLNPQALEHWGGRFATYFVDTDMFGVYALVLASLCLFSLDYVAKPAGKGLTILPAVGFVAGLYLVVGSQTRASWLALPFVLLLWLVLQSPRLERRRIFGLTAALVVVVGLAVVLFPGASARLTGAFSEVSQWFHGTNRHTSAGYRLTMWQMSWEFFKHSPWFGYGDGGVMVHLNEPWITAIADEESRGIISNGPHNEFLANLLRSGVLGGVSVLCLFFVPFVLFWRQRHNPDAQVAKAAHLGLAYLVSLIVCSISFEVFTLKYTATFYGLIISGLAAQVIRGQVAASNPGSSHVGD